MDLQSLEPMPTQILFMDDELSDADAGRLLEEARAAMEEQGWTVDTVENMDDAINAFRQQHYHAFVLDIDMHKQLQDANDSRRGTDVAKVYRSVDNGCAIVLYSGAGTVEDVFRAANLHTHAYIEKSQPIADLIEHIRKALEDESDSLRIPCRQTTGDILIVETNNSPFTREYWEELVSAAGPGFTPVFHSFQDAPRELRQRSYAAAAVAAPHFNIEQMKPIRELCHAQPTPHIVVACECRPEDKNTLIDLLNARPFRLANLLAEDPRKEILIAIESALAWYNGYEVFEAAHEYVREAVDRTDWEAILETRRELEEDAQLFADILDDSKWSDDEDDFPMDDEEALDNEE